jgi:hypothetical protein
LIRATASPAASPTNRARPPTHAMFPIVARTTTPRDGLVTDSLAAESGAFTQSRTSPTPREAHPKRSSPPGQTRHESAPQTASHAGSTRCFRGPRGSRLSGGTGCHHRRLERAARLSRKRLQIRPFRLHRGARRGAGQVHPHLYRPPVPPVPATRKYGAANCHRMTGKLPATQASPSDRGHADRAVRARPKGTRAESVVDRPPGGGCARRPRRDVLNLASTRPTQVSVGLGPHRLMSGSMPVAGCLPSGAARCNGGRRTDPGREEPTERVQHRVDTASRSRDRQDGWRLRDCWIPTAIRRGRRLRAGRGCIPGIRRRR